MSLHVNTYEVRTDGRVFWVRFLTQHTFTHGVRTVWGGWRKESETVTGFDHIASYPESTYAHLMGISSGKLGLIPRSERESASLCAGIYRLHFDSEAEVVAYMTKWFPLAERKREERTV